MKQLELLDEPDQRLKVSLEYCSPSLSSARAAVRDGREEGVICPCCDQLVKVYQRRINLQMARAALWMSGTPAGKYVDMTKAPADIIRNREYSRLALWGLAEAEPGRGSSGSRRGSWRLTEGGRLFVNGVLRVAEHVTVLNGRVIDVSRGTIGIGRVKGFDFMEVWNG